MGIKFNQAYNRGKILAYDNNYIENRYHEDEIPILTKVEIYDMWDEVNISCHLNRINILVGYNGTGKTTILNIIEAVLTVDLHAICNLYFKKCNLFFSNKYYICLEREIDENGVIILNYNIHNINDNSRILKRLIRVRNIENVQSNAYYKYNISVSDHLEIKSKINKIVNVAWLGIDRNKLLSFFDREENNHEGLLGIEKTISILRREITEYKHSIELQERQLLEEFRKQILKLMLYDDELDIISVSSPPSGMDWIEALKKAFRELGITDSEHKIEQHCCMVNNAFETLRGISHTSNQNNDLINAFGIISLSNRTQKILDLAATLEEKKKKNREHFARYQDIIKTFINKNLDGIHDNSKHKKLFNPHNLSSGEKQLFIFLSETLLQRNRPTLFLADEPELSLHISWQRKIIEAIHQLNYNAQLIFATHSPEVVSQWRKNVINMANITN